MNYDFNLLRLVFDYLPIRLRGAKMLSWLLCLFAPFERLKGEFITFTNQTQYNLKITGQVIVLQNYLNDKFDFLQRRIVLTETEVQNLYLWNTNEGQTNPNVFFVSENNTNPTLTFINEQGLGNNFDFTIEAPQELQNLEPKIKTLVNAFKLAGKTYNVNFI